MERHNCRSDPLSYFYTAAHMTEILLILRTQVLQVIPSALTPTLRSIPFTFRDISSNSFWISSQYQISTKLEERTCLWTLKLLAYLNICPIHYEIVVAVVSSVGVFKPQRMTDFMGYTPEITTANVHHLGSWLIVCVRTLSTIVCPNEHAGPCKYSHIIPDNLSLLQNYWIASHLLCSVWI